MSSSLVLAADHSKANTTQPMHAAVQLGGPINTCSGCGRYPCVPCRLWRYLGPTGNRMRITRFRKSHPAGCPVAEIASASVSKLAGPLYEVSNSPVNYRGTGFQLRWTAECKPGKEVEMKTLIVGLLFAITPLAQDEFDSDHRRFGWQWK